MKITALVIKFEAYGKIHIAYTHTWNHDSIVPTLHELGDTVHIRSISSNVIDNDLFIEQNLDKIIEWNTEIRLKIAS